MRFRHIALGCALTGVLGFLAMPPAMALADGTGPGAGKPALAGEPALASKPATPLVGRLSASRNCDSAIAWAVVSARNRSLQ